jgi:hypothetical protein
MNPGLAHPGQFGYENALKPRSTSMPTRSRPRRERVVPRPWRSLFGHYPEESDRMARAPRLVRTIPLSIALAILAPGCQLAPRSELEECRRLSQTLRSENAQLKDRALALQAQNRDLSERAVDDSRRLSQLEEVNTRLETSVQAYQDERSRLESAYKDLRASLPNAPQPLSMRSGDDEEAPPDARTRGENAPDRDADLRKTEGPDAEDPATGPSKSRNDARGPGRTWRAPSRTGDFRGQPPPAATKP